MGSLLTDPDFLLQSLRLSYIRQVLPSHSNLSLAPGTGPYNLISFPTSYDSPYITLAGLDDVERWPELTSGRHSPPLGGRERRRPVAGEGTGGLKYSQTIGKVGSGAGMRVDGRARSYKGRAGTKLGTITPDGTATTGEESGPEDAPPVSQLPTRHNSLERSLHHRRLGSDPSNINPALPHGPLNVPPPVVIHSPVRTPRDSPARSTSFALPADPYEGSTKPSHRLHEPSLLEQKGDDDVDQVRLVDVQILDEEEELEKQHQLFDAPAVVATADDTDGESQAQSHVSSQQLSSVPFSPQLASSIEGDLQSPVLEDDNAMIVAQSQPGVEESVASSGVSLFGVSRIGQSATSDQPLTAASIRRSRSDSSSSSSFIPRPTIIPEESSASSASSSDSDSDSPPKRRVIEPPTQQMLAAFPGLKNLRPQMRERRRVNIKIDQGGMLGAIKEPAGGEDEESTKSNVVKEKGKSKAVETDEKKTKELNLLIPPPPSQLPSNAPMAPSTPVTSTPNTQPGTPRRHHHHHHHHPITFVRRPPIVNPPPAPPTKSLLSSLLSSDSSPGSQNPFSTLYSALMSRPNSNEPSMSLTVYFPHSKTPMKKLKITVKKDITVEEVIGCGLLAYWENEWDPKLEVKEEEDPEGLTIGWNLRIVEDEGEVDEDFPALDRSRGISAFSFDEFAIVKATSTQVKDNQAKQSQIQRRPSRVLAPPKRNAAPMVPVPVSSAQQLGPPQGLHMGGSLTQAGTMGVSSALAVPVLLKVRLPPAPGVETINTTINVPNDMYMSDVLAHICKKRGLENPKDWALVVQHNESDIVVPLDRTVDSLGDRYNLTLVKRSQVAGLTDQLLARPGGLKNTNPSASIFKRLSEPPQPKYQSSSSALASAYQSYAVQRKLPMPLGRHPRIIAIDGDYIHFMPSDGKAMFDGGRTSSFHISNIHDCKISRRSPGSFKILVQKDRVEKRYDFEAESPRAAQTIVAHIRNLMINYSAEQQTRAGR